jgi:hypothetical protein
MPAATDCTIQEDAFLEQEVWVAIQLYRLTSLAGFLLTWKTAKLRYDLTQRFLMPAVAVWLRRKG